MVIRDRSMLLSLRIQALLILDIRHAVGRVAEYEAYFRFVEKCVDKGFVSGIAAAKNVVAQLKNISQFN